MRLKNKFLLLGALTVGLVMMLALLAALQLHTLQTKEEQRHAAAAELETAGQHILTANVEFKKQIQHWKNILLRGNNLIEFNAEKAAFLNQERLVQLALLEAAKVRKESNNAQATINALLTEHSRLSEQYKNILRQFDPKDVFSGKKIDAQIRGIDQTFTLALQSKVDSLTLGARKLRQLNDTATAQELQQAQIRIATASLLCVLALIALMYFILRSVLRQIGGDPQEAMFVAKQVARGNLAVQIAAPAPHSVLSHLQDMMYGLSDIVVEVDQACAELNRIAQYVDNTSAQLAKNATEQARMVTINSSALEQIAVTVAQNAEHSKQLAQLVDTTPETADLITEINCASKEQASAVAENSKNLMQLARSTHENALQAEKLSRSANGLYAQTHQLGELINQFQTA